MAPLLFSIMACGGLNQSPSPESLEQLQQDSIRVYALNTRFKETYRSDLQGARLYLDSAHALAKKANHKWGEAWSYRYYGIYHSSKNEYYSALTCLMEGKKIFSSLNDINGQSACLNGMANIVSDQGDYEKALAYYQETISLNKSIDNDKGVAIAYHNIGNLHYSLGQYDQALTNFKRSLEIKQKLQDSLGMIGPLNGISAVYSVQGQDEKSLSFAYQALELAKIFEDKKREANIYNNLGYQYYKVQELDSAAIFYKKALATYKSIGDRGGAAVVFNNLGGIELIRENGAGAIAYNDSSLALAKEIGHAPTVRQAYQGLAEAYKLLGQYPKAYFWLEKFHGLKDSISGENIRLQINTLEAKFEKGENERQIAILKEKEANVREKNKLYLAILVISVFTFLVLILAILFYFRNQRAKAKIIQHKLKQKALRAQMNPHFIFNSLNSIQRLYVEGKEDLANDYMADFSQLLRRILENSGKQSISLEDELAIAKGYLELELLRTDHAFSFSVEMDSALDAMSFMVPPLILQPYLENAVWHGILPKKTPGTIQIKVYQKNTKMVVCEIIDNGIGIESSKHKNPGRNSMGMQITQERLGGSANVQVEGIETGGTKITLTLTNNL